MNEFPFPENSADIRIQQFNKPFGTRYNGTNLNSTFNTNVTIPKNFSWNIITDDDNESIKLVKERILKPISQGVCGNCYAVALAGVLSDLFLIKYGLNENPDLSSSYLNIHYTGMNDNIKGCGGGNPVSALKAISKDGIVGKKCVDNSVCLTNPQCNGMDKDNVPSSELNNLYNTIGEGCYKNDNKSHKLYFPEVEDKDVYFKVYPNYDRDLANEILHGAKTANDFVENTDTGLLTYPSGWNILHTDQKEAMTQIYRNGPGVGMAILLNNFMYSFYRHPDFENTFDGIFFDSVVWNDDGSHTYQNPQLVNCGIRHPPDYSLEVDGGHAVAVIGYGVSDKEIPLFDFKTNKLVNVKNIPFWWVRNSWDTTWNPKYKGCVKIAMYPFNKVTQFDVPIGEHIIDKNPVTIPVPYVGNRVGVGGILFIEAGDIVDYKNYESNKYYQNNPDLTDNSKYLKYEDPEYYTTTSQKYIVKGGVKRDANAKFVSSTSSPKKNNNILIFIIVICFLCGLFIIYKKFLKARIDLYLSQSV